MLSHRVLKGSFLNESIYAKGNPINSKKMVVNVANLNVIYKVVIKSSNLYF